MTRALKILLLAALAAATLATALTVPASAQRRSVAVRMADGTIQSVVVETAPEATLEDLEGLVPGEPVSYQVLEEQPPPAPPPSPETEVAPLTAPEPPAPAPGAPAPLLPPTPAPAPGETAENLHQEEPPTVQELEPERSRSKPPKQQTLTLKLPKAKVRVQPEVRTKIDGGAEPAPLRRSDGSPAVSNPGFVDALPGPSLASGVPNFVIRKFRVPVFLLPIYQAAGIEYGVRWEILAAINEIETDYGRNLNVSSAGALGWMQFIPSSWKAYGVDANKDGVKDPYNPVDAIFAAGRYLKAAGYEQDVRKSIFAYNHAGWYVDSVMLRARLIAGVPSDLVGSLTGLTEGRFPVAARARYADDLQENEQLKRVKAGENAANIVESDDTRKTVSIFARKGSPVVATNDGIIKKIGAHKIVLQDPYGNRYTYTGLGKTAKYHPVLKDDSPDNPNTAAKALAANKDAAPAAPASAGAQPAEDKGGDSRKKKKRSRANRDRSAASVPFKQRLFAHPDMPQARAAGGLDQLLEAKARREGGFATYRNYFARPFDAKASNVELRPLRKGSQVIGGTVLGRVGRPVEGEGAHMKIAIRPAGKGAPQIDPKPILDGWKLLEATAIYRASGRNVLYGSEGSDGFSIGQILLLPKPLLEKRVLSDERIDVYGCGRADIRSGQIDRRVLATLAYLAESGLRPTVTSLKCGHGFFTSSGGVSHHSSGNAVDIGAINGVSILGHQEAGGVTEQAVRRMMSLQGTLQADQIISLLDLGGQTFAMGDHADHIHVGFQPLFGNNAKLGKQALAVLKPGQWSDLLDQLKKIENPVVPTKPSKYAIPAEKRSSDAHKGE